VHPAVWNIFSGINLLDGRQMPEQFLVMSEILHKIKFTSSPYAVLLKSSHSGPACPAGRLSRI